MAEQTATDARDSIQSGEFSWDIDGSSEAHGYLLQPVVRALVKFGARTVLDLGCGNGSLSNELARRSFTVTGMDHSLSGIERARRNYPGATFLQHDLSAPIDAGFAQRFDAVVATEVIEHLLLPRMLMRNARLALRPGGLLVVTTPYHGYWKNLALALSNGFDAHWHPLRDYGHVKFFSRATLTRLFQESGFTDLQFSTAGRFAPLAKSMVLAGVMCE